MEHINNKEFLLNNIGQYKYKNIYSIILKTAKEYDCSKDESVTYDYSFNEEDIWLLKNMFDIESLKGETEFQTFINATNWVSTILRPSNKMIKGPAGKAGSIIKDVASGKYAANCYGYAVVLNEVLCALGYKCKYIFCYPIAFHFIDCHVVNLVYSKEYSKWILLDAAQNVFYTDKNGIVLNIEELRSCIINDLPIEAELLTVYQNIKYLDKNLIRQKMITYMTKNLYRFGCYKNPQKDRTASNRAVDFYNLVPLSFMDTLCSISEYHRENNIKRTEHFTLNPNVYWSIPL